MCELLQHFTVIRVKIEDVDNNTVGKGFNKFAAARQVEGLEDLSESQQEARLLAVTNRDSHWG